ELLDKSYGEMIPSEVTVRQVLNHSSGLSDYFSQKEYQEAVHTHPEKPWTYEKLMEVGLKNTPLFPPGEGWMYSNPGYALIKELIAHLGGMTDEEWMAKHILEPLGLADTRYFKQLDTSGCLLPGNDPEMDGDFRARYHPGWIATGCFISTVSDVVRFYDGLFSNKLVNADSLAEMTSVVDLSYPLKPPSTAAYGLGLMHAKNHPLGKSYGHGGGGPGYTTYAQHYPEKNLSLAMVWNRSIPQTPFDWADEVVCSLKYSV
ncbi:MAG: serine hydrolase domain-containing protein, partial [Akkermansiaceae bacterium]